MFKTKTAVSFAVALAVLPKFGYAQVSAQPQDARSAEAQVKMEKMAAALGAAVYEDFAVSADGQAGGTGGVAYTRFQPPLRLEVPVPTQVKSAAVPNEFDVEEKAPFSATVHTLWHALGTQISDLGWFGGKPPSFEAISERVMKQSKSKAFPARKAGQPSLFTDAGFVAEFEAVTGARFSDGNAVRFLIDGPASFSVKDDLIKNAKKNLLISSWAFYDDTTGYEAAQMLIAKHREGVSVKVLVDGIMSKSHGPKVLKMMEDAGIELIRHHEKKRSNDIWHVKVMIADDQYAVAGGMNFGDYYSHKGHSCPKWRDTDVYFSGPAVLAARRILVEAWNSQVDQQKLKFGKIDARDPQDGGFEGGQGRVAVVLQNPPEHSPILVSIVKAMYGATKTINIENAYFVAIPAVSQAVLDARARGVEVNLVTNSKESIDAEGKPIVDAMNKCLIPLLKAGVNIYLKQGALETLHSKFITVDGEFADIGSYNLHPRGERIDTEVNVNILDRGAVARLDAAFADDVAKARQVLSETELSEKPGFMSQVMNQFFYAQLSPKK